MDKKETLDFILQAYYPMICEFLGEIIEQRLNIPNYENGVLTSQLLNAARKEAAQKEDEYLEGSDLDADLYSLDQTLSFGEERCEGFKLIFQDVDLSQYQDADAKILDTLAQVKAFECLSKFGFDRIATIDSLQNRLQIDYVARKSPDYYAVVVTRLYSAQYAEEHSDEYGVEKTKEWLTVDIANTIDRKYLQIEKFCQRKIGAWKGIIFISSGRDYFGNKKYENKLYGLQPAKVFVVLNKEWTKRKEGRENYKYLHYVVITTGRNVRNAITYPSLN